MSQRPLYLACQAQLTLLLAASLTCLTLSHRSMQREATCFSMSGTDARQLTSVNLPDVTACLSFCELEKASDLVTWVHQPHDMGAPLSCLPCSCAETEAR